MNQHLWTSVNKAVDQLSTTQAAVIGGVGSGASAVSVLSLDGDTWLHWFTLGCGAVGAVLSVSLLVLKFIQQRREMSKWRKENAEEHDALFVSSAASVLDRSGMHDEIAAITKDSEHLQKELASLKRRCGKCGHLHGE